MKYATRTLSPMLAKAVRIVLVFSLVFWTSLRLEWMVAYAEDDDNETAPVTQADDEGDDAEPQADDDEEEEDEGDQDAADAILDRIRALPESADDIDAETRDGIEEEIASIESVIEGLDPATRALVEDDGDYGRLDDAKGALKDFDAAQAEEEAARAEAQEAASAVLDKIAALPDEVNADNRDEVAGAIDEIDGDIGELSDLARELLEGDDGYGHLQDVRDALSAYDEADKVAALIEALPEPSAVTAADAEAIEEASAAYGELTDEEKALVAPELVQKLADCEDALTPEARAGAVKAMIEALPNPDEITEDDREAVEGARAAYDELVESVGGEDEARALVGEDLVQKLTDCEKKLDGASFEEEQRYDFDAHKEGEDHLTDIQVWEAGGDAGDEVAGEDAVAKASDNKDEVSEITLKVGDDLKLIGVPMWAADGELAEDWKPAYGTTKAIEWKVEDESLDETAAEGATAEGAEGTEAVDGTAETATSPAEIAFGEEDSASAVELTGKAAGELTLVGTITEEYQDLIDPAFSEGHDGKPFEVRLKVKVEKEEELPPYITLELLDKNGETLANHNPLDWNEAELREGYQFNVKVAVHKAEKNDEGIVSEGEVLEDFMVDPEQGLAEMTKEKYGDRFTNLTWRVYQVTGEEKADAEEAVATIDDKGNFKLAAASLEAAGLLRVEVSSEQGFNGAVSISTDIGQEVEEKEVVDIQGESHPQSTLKVTSNALVVPKDAAASGAAADASASAAAADSTASGATASTSSASASSAAAAKPEPISVEYGMDELGAFSTGEGEFTMPVEGGTVKVKGQGFYLEQLIREAGIPAEAKITSVEFEDYSGSKARVPWTELTGAGSALVATASRVLEDTTLPEGAITAEEAASAAAGSAAAASPSGSAAAADPSAGSADPAASAAAADPDALLENTRFRILYAAPEGSKADANALRYIKHIHVNVKPGEDDPEVDPDLKVSIDYKPVPKGKVAELVAVPNKEIGSGSYNLQWQYSSDGANWTDVEKGGTVQTLRVMTDDEHIGLWYRVILTSELTNEDDKNRVAISDPVQIEPATEPFSVTLAYDPPVAGDTAIFTSSVYAMDRNGDQITIDSAKLSYTWEMKTAATGASWVTIPGEFGASLAIPTDPVDSSASSSKDKGETDGNQLTYIRVRVKTTDERIPADKREAVSEMQPLTVYVGDPEGTGEDKSGSNDDKKDEGSSPKPPDNSTPSGGDDSDDEETMQELPGVTIRYGDDPDPDPTPSTQPDPTSQEELEDEPDAAASDSEDTQIVEEPEQTKAQETPAPTPMPSEVIIDPEITSLIEDQKEKAAQDTKNSQPGARWTELDMINPTQQDIADILADNPFAPFAMPMGLGMVAAGGVEKILAFRRQTRVPNIIDNVRK